MASAPKHRRDRVLGIVVAVLAVAAVLVTVGLYVDYRSGDATAAGSVVYTPEARPSPLGQLDVPATGARALFFGDSYVHGTGANAEGTGFVAQTAAAMGWTPIVQYYPGEGYLRTQSTKGGPQMAYPATMASLDPALAPDVIIIEGGLNDLGAAAIAPGMFKPAVAQTVQTVKAKWPGKPILLMAPIDPRGTLANKISVVTREIGDVAVSEQTAFFDPAPLFPKAQLADLIAVDGNHPNQTGHDLIASTLTGLLRQLTGSTAGATPAAS